MKKRVLGIILSIVGITILILAFVFIIGFNGTNHVMRLLACGISGAILFFAGIWLIPGTKTGLHSLDRKVVLPILTFPADPATS
jgi:hypothetical protein